MSSLAIFGGTFDPVHNGHIQASLAIQAQFDFDNYYFVPCKIPTLKHASLANSQQRITMLELALRPYKEFIIDLREIQRDTPSYMVETLQSYRKENKEASITLIMGYDAFLSLPKWHQWDKIIELANLLVINRASYTSGDIPEEIHDLLKNHQCDMSSQLLKSPSGAIMFFDAGNYDISSTNIRYALKQKHNVEHMLPDEVYRYIKELGLYQ